MEPRKSSFSFQFFLSIINENIFCVTRILLPSNILKQVCIVIFVDINMYVVHSKFATRVWLLVELCELSWKVKIQLLYESSKVKKVMQGKRIVNFMDSFINLIDVVGAQHIAFLAVYRNLLSICIVVELLSWWSKFYILFEVLS